MACYAWIDSLTDRCHDSGFYICHARLCCTPMSSLLYTPLHSTPLLRVSILQSFMRCAPFLQKKKRSSGSRSATAMPMAMAEEAKALKIVLPMWITVIAAAASSSMLISMAQGFNITNMLREHPQLSTFNSLLSATAVADEINGRTSLTILAPTNAQLAPLLATFAGGLPTQQISDLLRFHVLLEYLDMDRLSHMPAHGSLVTTLYQTTGRAPNATGALNITATATGQVHLALPLPDAPAEAALTGIFAEMPYVVSIARVSRVLYPYGFGAASPPTSPPAVNVTDVLARAQGFNFMVALMAASGVGSEFQADETGAGITVFAPTDDAFGELSPHTLEDLPAQSKAMILRFHVLMSYYPLGSLQTIVNPMQPTLATQAAGAGTYTLNITRFRGMLAVSTGLVVAPVTQTVFDQKPLAVFAVPRVLLPKEIFAPPSPPLRNSAPSAAPAIFGTELPPENVLTAPISEPVLAPPPSPAADVVAPASSAAPAGSGISVSVPALFLGFLVCFLCCRGFQCL